MLAFLYGRFQGVNAVSYRLLLLYSARMLSQSVVSIRDPTDCSLPDSSVHGIPQAGILEWVAISSSRASSDPGIELTSLASPALADKILYHCASWDVY